MNRTFYVDEVRERFENNKVQFNSPSKFNYTSDYYDNVSINEQSDLNIYSEGKITVWSASSGVGTASTITSEYIISPSFIGNFSGSDVLANNGQIGLLTVTSNANVSGIITFSVGSATTITTVELESTTLNMPDGDASIFVGSSRINQPPGYGTTTGTFVGIGTSARMGGLAFVVDGGALLDKVVIGVSTFTTLPSNTQYYDSTRSNNLDIGLSVIKRNLYLENCAINIVSSNTDNDFSTNQISIGNSEMSTPYVIGDSYGKVVIGFGTNNPRSVLDFSHAGRGNIGFQDMRFMLPPSLTTTERIGLTTAEGAMIFNKTTKKHQLYDGTTWHDMY